MVIEDDSPVKDRCKCNTWTLSERLRDFICLINVKGAQNAQYHFFRRLSLDVSLPCRVGVTVSRYIWWEWNIRWHSIWLHVRSYVNSKVEELGYPTSVRLILYAAPHPTHPMHWGISTLYSSANCLPPRVDKGTLTVHFGWSSSINYPIYKHRSNHFWHSFINMNDFVHFKNDIVWYD